MPIPTDALAALDAKGQSSSPAQPAAPAPQQNAPAAPQADDDAGNDAESDEAIAGKTVNLKRAYSRMMEALTKLADESGVNRSATIPYIHDGSMSDHINAVGGALQKVGGLTANILTTHHHTGGRGYGSGDGSTQAFPAEKLRQTLVTKNDPNAKAVIDAAKSYISKIRFLIGDDPTVKVAESQLKLIGQNNFSGMNLFDVMAAVINLVHPPTQAVARGHQLFKHGEHHTTLTAPRTQG